MTVKLDDTEGRYTPYVVAEHSRVVCSNCRESVPIIWPREGGTNLPAFYLCSNCGQFAQLGVDVIVAGAEDKRI